MDSPQSPGGNSRRQGRNVSQPLVRRTTRGPLDAIDGPLAESVTSPSITSPLEDVSPAVSTEDLQPNPQLPEPALTERTKTEVNVGFLLDPNIYHALLTDDVHPAFLSSDQQPPPQARLEELLQPGHFRRAADAAAKELLRCDRTEADSILPLLYTRLACLVLISRSDIAALEATPLAEFLARNTPGARDCLPHVPWELRLLIVRLQALGTADGGRRCIMSLYSLASETRAMIRQALDYGNERERQVWSDRLHDLGLRVADALVEMGELETVERHLDTLIESDTDEIAYRKALLRIRLGNIVGARRCLENVHDGSRREALSALLITADGEYTKSISLWRQLVDRNQDYALSANNLAACMLYTGHITEARQILEQLADERPGLAASLFNLSTVYELCTERAGERKDMLAQRLATKQPSAAVGGWEKTNFDLKL
ncbi:hypothetical protein BAUCODRAFT_27350 [Baudoinia panamericana UAMH 10762]|uniref:Tetratricopeptide repeat protein n=1 Tax=Baudoinia panamericana (strain UAMH 10762) TaxID=717646 RepID=M2LG98_BAUPA|nr:uncharacterized protein BAUCODRAFT_27350 [Baudoinia panamericana UAMH 10762]EMC93067.1 hypothetical protein BAUCODRAFT_27350 [Baudoinia panamericana UAMH 10762]